MIKTFRGLLADGEQETIRLSTNNGMTGYKIKKFKAITNNPGGGNAEHVLKVWTREQSTIDNLVDFDNSELLAVGLATNAATGYSTFYNERIVFDNITFNQDIFITHFENHSTEACNYYLELEQVKLDLSEATVATLKDMRGTN